MCKHSIAILFLLVLFCDVTKGQQEAQFSHNMFNNMGVNPGYAGLRNAICATVLARQQWAGFRDEEGTRVNPETYSFTVDAPIQFLRGGVGLGFLQDQLGFENSLGVKVAYAYHLDLDYGKMGIGGQIGIVDKRIDFTKFRPISENDPVLGGAGEESSMLSDFALGVFYKHDDQFWGGISMSQITQTTKQIGNASYRMRRHTYISAGYNHTLPGNPLFTISPSALLKTDFNALQIDVSALVTYNKKFWGGASYRLQDAAVIFLGLNFEQISIGYSYDITLSPLGRSGRSYGSHELFIQYCFSLDLEKIKETHRNVRFL